MISLALMMTNQIGLVVIGIIAQMMGYLILTSKRTISLVITLNLTQKFNYLYHLIYQRQNQPYSSEKIKLMQSCEGVVQQVFSHQKSGSYAMLMNFRNRHLSFIILRPFLNEPKICQLNLLKKSYHRS